MISTSGADGRYYFGPVPGGVAMDGRILTRLTNAGLLVAVGMGGGHVLMPARTTASLLSRAVFVASVAGTGALSGWRERRAREYDGGEDVRGPEALWVLTGAMAALVLAALAYWLMHGTPR